MTLSKELTTILSDLLAHCALRVRGRDICTIRVLVNRLCTLISYIQTSRTPTSTLSSVLTSSLDEQSLFDNKSDVRNDIELDARIEKVYTRLGTRKDTELGTRESNAIGTRKNQELGTRTDNAVGTRKDNESESQFVGFPSRTEWSSMVTLIVDSVCSMVTCYTDEDACTHLIHSILFDVYIPLIECPILTNPRTTWMLFVMFLWLLEQTKDLVSILPELSAYLSTISNQWNTLSMSQHSRQYSYNIRSPTRGNDPKQGQILDALIKLSNLALSQFRDAISLSTQSTQDNIDLNQDTCKDPSIKSSHNPDKRILHHTCSLFNFAMQFTPTPTIPIELAVLLLQSPILVCNSEDEVVQFVTQINHLGYISRRYTSGDTQQLWRMIRWGWVSTDVWNSWSDVWKSSRAFQEAQHHRNTFEEQVLRLWIDNVTLHKSPSTNTYYASNTSSRLYPGLDDPMSLGARPSYSFSLACRVRCLLRHQIFNSEGNYTQTTRQALQHAFKIIENNFDYTIPFTIWINPASPLQDFSRGRISKIRGKKSMICDYVNNPIKCQYFDNAQQWAECLCLNCDLDNTNPIQDSVINTTPTIYSGADCWAAILEYSCTANLFELAQQYKKIAMISEMQSCHCHNTDKTTNSASNATGTQSSQNPFHWNGDWVCCADAARFAILFLRSGIYHDTDLLLNTDSNDGKKLLHQLIWLSPSENPDSGKYHTLVNEMYGPDTPISCLLYLPYDYEGLVQNNFIASMIPQHPYIYFILHEMSQAMKKHITFEAGIRHGCCTASQIAKAAASVLHSTGPHWLTKVIVQMSTHRTFDGPVQHSTDCRSRRPSGSGVLWHEQEFCEPQDANRANKATDSINHFERWAYLRFVERLNANIQQQCSTRRISSLSCLRKQRRYLSSLLRADFIPETTNDGIARLNDMIYLLPNNLFYDVPINAYATLNSNPSAKFAHLGKNTQIIVHESQTKKLQDALRRKMHANAGIALSKFAGILSNDFIPHLPLSLPLTFLESVEHNSPSGCRIIGMQQQNGTTTNLHEQGKVRPRRSKSLPTIHIPSVQNNTIQTSQLLFNTCPHGIIARHKWDTSWLPQSYLNNVRESGNSYYGMYGMYGMSTYY